MIYSSRYLYFKAVLFLALFMAVGHAYCQPVYVPYRVGDKFGIGDENGKMIIKPQFDFIIPAWDKNSCFFAYTITDSSTLSSVIYHNKIIISKQKYSYYYLYNGLILAYEYKILDKKAAIYGKNVQEGNDLYNTNGLKVLNGNYPSINIFSELDREGLMDEILLCTDDANNKYSLHVYNKKLKKIVRTYFNKSNYMEIDHNHSRNYLDTSVTFIYRDATGKGREIKISKRGKSFVRVRNKAVSISDEEKEYDDRVDMAIGGDYPEIERKTYKPSISEDSIILKVKRVEIKSYYSYMPRKVEEIEIKEHTFDIKDYYVLIKNGKKGLIYSRADTFIVKPKYDEIMFAEIHPQHGGYILRNGDKYGFYIYNYPNNRTIEPIFDKIALVANLDYFKKDGFLLKLYDQNGKLFCYANLKGKLFYREK